MTGDYTRNTFRPEKQYSGVRQQQGRVHMDADWNEAVDIALHRKRVALQDVIGPTGVPEDAPGFALTAVSNTAGSDLVIGPGRAYVDGVLVDHAEAEVTTLEKVSGSGVNTIWQVIDGPRFAEGQWVVLEGGAVSDAETVSEVLAPEEGDGGLQRLKFSKALGGGEKRVVGLASLGAQPNLPDPPAVTDAGPYLIYLDVWERVITALEDPSVKDVALGGPDTALRTQVVWQAEHLALQPLIDAGAVTDPPVCKSFGAGWSPLGDGPFAALAARTNPTEDTPDPCLLPSAGGYRSLENRLYRVEVHVGGVVGTDDVFVKWSRDNAIHRSRLLDVTDGSLVVEDAGKDDVTAFKQGDWLEVLDEARILGGQAGYFVELGEVVGTRLGIQTILDPVTLEPLTTGVAPDLEPDTALLPGRGIVRRWEGGKPVAATLGTWIVLENGVEVQVGTGLSTVGDYWLIPARTTTASIEWPADAGSGAPEFLPPVGTVHRFMPLGIAERAADGTWTVTDDCRNIFPPLTRLESFFYLGGDGQETMPDLVGTGQGTLAPLDQPLRTGVARGRSPVSGRLVRFTVGDPNKRGQLAPSPGTDAADVVTNTGNVLIVRTNDDGVAEAAFSLDRRRDTHHVLAELLDADDPAQADRVHLPIAFTANVSVAAEVAYDPDECPYQAERSIEPGVAQTVQQALDKLCPRLELVLLGGDGQELCVGERAPAPLTVGVFWGKQPLEGVRVKYEVTSGDATVDPVEAVTDASGLASTAIVAGADALKDGGVVVVEAVPGGTAVAASPKLIAFTARFINAKCVYLDEDVCPDGQTQMKSNTVAALIKFLCRSGGGGNDDGIHVRAVNRSGGPLVLDEVLSPAILARGLQFEFDAALDPNVVKSAISGIESRPVGEVIIDLPWPFDGGVTVTWTGDDVIDPFATRATRLDGIFSIPGNRRTRLNWKPSRRAIRWLTSELLQRVERLQRVAFEARVVLYSNRIWSREGLFLDGDLFANLNAAEGVTYPSGDGVRGGNFVLPFYVGGVPG